MWQCIKNRRAWLHGNTNVPVTLTSVDRFRSLNPLTRMVWFAARGPTAESHSRGIHNRPIGLRLRPHAEHVAVGMHLQCPGVVCRRTADLHAASLAFLVQRF